MGLVFCPSCGTAKTRLAARHSVADRLFGCVTVYPFRCQLCARRFRTFLGRPAESPRRNFDRVTVDFPVWFKPLGSAPYALGCEGVLRDLSIRGCRIYCDHPMVSGTRLELEFQHSNNSFPITVDEAIVQSSSGGALGLRFVRLDRQDQRRLRGILDIWMPEPTRAEERPTGVGRAGDRC